MAINQRLDLKQGQTLTMTPQLQQAIKLLQMSNIELNEFVEAELEKNPLLERDESMSSEKPHDDAPAAEPSEGQPDNPEGTPPQDGGSEGEAREPHDEPGGRELDTDFENVFTGGSMAEQPGGYDAFATSSFATVGKGGSLKFDDPEYSFENNMAKEATLRDYDDAKRSIQLVANWEPEFASAKQDLDALGALLHEAYDRRATGDYAVAIQLSRADALAAGSAARTFIDFCVKLQRRGKAAK